MRTFLALAVLFAVTCACARRDCCDRPVDRPVERAEAWTWGRFQRAEPDDGPHKRIELEGVIRELDGRVFVVKPRTEVRTYDEIRDSMLPDDYRRCLLLVRPDDPTVRSLVGLRVRVTGTLRWTKSEFDWGDEPRIDEVRFQLLH